MLMCRINANKYSKEKKMMCVATHANVKICEKRKSLSSFLIFCVLEEPRARELRGDTKFVAICESFAEF